MGPFASGLRVQRGPGVLNRHNGGRGEPCVGIGLLDQNDGGICLAGHLVPVRGTDGHLHRPGTKPVGVLAHYRGQRRVLLPHFLQHDLVGIGAHNEYLVLEPQFPHSLGGAEG